MNSLFIPNRIPMFAQYAAGLQQIEHKGYCYVLKKVLPCNKAAIPTMISTAFPNDAFNRPAHVEPNLMDISSVETPRS